MGGIVVIGPPALVGGFALAGADVRAVDDTAGALAAVQSLPPDTALVVLTADAAEWLPPVGGHPSLLVAVLPR